MEIIVIRRKDEIIVINERLKEKLLLKLPHFPSIIFLIRMPDCILLKDKMLCKFIYNNLHEYTA